MDAFACPHVAKAFIEISVPSIENECDRHCRNACGRLPAARNWTAHDPPNSPTRNPASCDNFGTAFFLEQLDLLSGKFGRVIKEPSGNVPTRAGQDSHRPSPRATGSLSTVRGRRWNRACCPVCRSLDCVWGSGKDDVDLLQGDKFVGALRRPPVGRLIEARFDPVAFRPSTYPASLGSLDERYCVFVPTALKASSSSAPPAAPAPRAATPPPAPPSVAKNFRRSMWLAMRPSGGGSFMQWRDDITLPSRGLYLRPIGRSSECSRITAWGQIASGRRCRLNDRGRDTSYLAPPAVG